MTYREAQKWENEELQGGGELRAQQEDSRVVGKRSERGGAGAQKRKK